MSGRVLSGDGTRKEWKSPGFYPPEDAAPGRGHKKAGPKAGCGDRGKDYSVTAWMEDITKEAPSFSSSVVAGAQMTSRM